MNFAVALQVITFLVEHKEDIKKLVLALESLIGDQPGGTKAAAVKQYIGTALNISEQLEQVWPLVAPLFNLFVAATKSAK